MQLEHVLGTRGLVQTVDVLGDQAGYSTVALGQR